MPYYLASFYLRACNSLCAVAGSCGPQFDVCGQFDNQSVAGAAIVCRFICSVMASAGTPSAAAICLRTSFTAQTQLAVMIFSGASQLAVVVYFLHFSGSLHGPRQRWRQRAGRRVFRASRSLLEWLGDQCWVTANSLTAVTRRDHRVMGARGPPWWHRAVTVLLLLAITHSVGAVQDIPSMVLPAAAGVASSATAVAAVAGGAAAGASPHSITSDVRDWPALPTTVGPAPAGTAHVPAGANQALPSIAELGALRKPQLHWLLQREGWRPQRRRRVAAPTHTGTAHAMAVELHRLREHRQSQLACGQPDTALPTEDDARVRTAHAVSTITGWTVQAVARRLHPAMAAVGNNAVSRRSFAVANSVSASNQNIVVAQHMSSGMLADAALQSSTTKAVNDADGAAAPGGTSQCSDPGIQSTPAADASAANAGGMVSPALPVIPPALPMVLPALPILSADSVGGTSTGGDAVPGPSKLPIRRRVARSATAPAQSTARSIGGAPEPEIESTLKGRRRAIHRSYIEPSTAPARTPRGRGVQTTLPRGARQSPRLISTVPVAVDNAQTPTRQSPRLHPTSPRLQSSSEPDEEGGGGGGGSSSSSSNSSSNGSDDGRVAPAGSSEDGNLSDLSDDRSDH